MLCDNLDGWDGGDGREVQEGGDIGIHIADSLHCTAETNTTLKAIILQVKKKKKDSILCLETLRSGISLVHWAVFILGYARQFASLFCRCL